MITAYRKISKYKLEVFNVSPIDGKQKSIIIDGTLTQLEAWLNGEVIQRAFPELSIDEREFMISGLLPGEMEKFLEGIL